MGFVFKDTILYFYVMKAKANKKDNMALREEILQSLRASFKIEKIAISDEAAHAALKKVEANLEK